MTIELLPATPSYPPVYHVRPDQCGCIFEMCTSTVWMVYDNKGNPTGVTFYYKEDAEIYAEEMQATFVQVPLR